MKERRNLRQLWQTLTAPHAVDPDEARPARLKGAHVIITGISDAVAEAIVDLGIDWHDIETLRDLQTGLQVALTRMRR